MGRFKAPIAVNVDTEQVKRLMARIQGIDKRAGRAAIKKGINEISRAVLWAAKENVPKRSGILRKSLGRKVLIARGGASVVGVVKPRSTGWVSVPPNFVQQWKTRTTKSGKTLFRVPKYHGSVDGKRVNPVRYAHLVEYGRASVVVKKKKVLANGTVIFGTHVRAVAPHPFLRPAWQQNEGQAVPILHKWLSEALRDYWNKSRYGTPRARRKR